MQIMAKHHSHYEFFRSPFGAVKCGSRIRLRVILQSNLSVEECCLRLWVEHKEVLLPMTRLKAGFIDLVRFPSGPKEIDIDEGEIYEAEYVVPDEPGLVWYFFIFKVDSILYYYGNNEGRLGGEGELRCGEPPGYQITVYKPMDVPSWYTQGIMYQIYVDRFFNGEEDGKVLNPHPRSLIHGNWEDTPFYIKNEKGEVVRWDFFGGNLLGVLKKLPYLKELGISIIYFNPIFTSTSNHKYDTGDYLGIDPMYGDENAFATLVKEAARLGISIILDGVFSHTGDDSIYFNRYGNYPGLGAYQSAASPYYAWYKWKGERNFSCWWGVGSLPEINEMEPAYREFIINSPQGVLQTWMKKGIKGWRLDVADELPDEFIQEFRRAMKAIDPEAVLIGEVWEDPTNKISHGQLRQYFWGAELDGTMNYPFREIFLEFFLGQIDANRVHLRVMSLYENYPRENFFGAMNLIGSHDRARILTLLGEAPLPEELSVYEQESFCLAPHQRWLGVQRLKLFTLIQMSFPGVPCLYYGDEAGVEGYSDPYNRGTYPWGKIDLQILEWFKRVLYYRREYKILRTGEFSSWPMAKDVYALKRSGEEEEMVIIVNRSVQEAKEVQLKLAPGITQVIDIIAGEVVFSKNFRFRDPDSEVTLQGFKDSTKEYLQSGNESQTVRSVLKLDMLPLTGKALLFQKTPLESFFKQEIMRRTCGILMHITSLPSPWGIGDLGKEAYKFVDFLDRSGQSLWQVLPLNPIGVGDSPYQSESAFAGNPLLISIDSLIQEGLLMEEEVKREYARFQAYPKDHSKHNHTSQGFFWFREFKEKLLRLAYSRFRDKVINPGSGFDQWEGNDEGNEQGIDCSEYLNLTNHRSFIKANRGWLHDYALFKSLKSKYPGLSWNEWEKWYRGRDSKALELFAEEASEEVDYIYFVQYTFEYQWQKLKCYANGKGIKIIGDMPIFVAYDSCDVWANRKIFALDSENNPLSSAGVPPDYFSPTGQNWGNPLYDWEQLAVEDYKWWKLRLGQALQRFDVLRLDHFRGFAAYWEIPAGSETAERGRWLKGPGKRFFENLIQEFGPLPVIAEDLGTITPEVNALKCIFGFPGMKVLQFSPLEELEQPRQRDHGEMASVEVVYYSGTHDNDTLLGWYLAQGYGLEDALKLVEKGIEDLYQSPAAWVILPLQDILKLDAKTRMNIPGTIEGNWQWRVEKLSLAENICAELRSLAKKYGRAGI